MPLDEIERIRTDLVLLGVSALFDRHRLDRTEEAECPIGHDQLGPQAVLKTALAAGRGRSIDMTGNSPVDQHGRSGSIGRRGMVYLVFVHQVQRRIRIIYA